MWKFGVVTLPQSHLNLFVVSDLLFVFFCGQRDGANNSLQKRLSFPLQLLATDQVDFA